MIPDRRQFRDRRHYAAALATEAVAPALRAFARLNAAGAPTPPGAWRHGVILGGGHVGDVLYRTCSLEHLHAHLPNCAWTYVTMPLAAEVLRGNPALREVLPLLQHAAANSISDTGLTHLRARGFDVALCTDNVRQHEALRVALALRVPNRVAFTKRGFSALATCGVEVARASWPEQIRAMVETVTGVRDDSPVRPRVYLDARDVQRAAEEWNALPFDDAPLTIACAVTTRQHLGLFPPALFATILRAALEGEPEARIVLAGASDDAEILERVAAAVGSRCIVRAGTIPLRTFAGVLSRCDAFLGSDSGPRHLANAAGLPVFFVRNMSVPEIEAGRYCETETDIAPRGQYLTDSATMAALATIDAPRIAAALVAAARRHSATVG